MKPVSPVFPGYDVPEIVYGKDQIGYDPLHAVPVNDGKEGRITRWHLSPEDRERIANGEDIFVYIQTSGYTMQPITMKVCTPAEIVSPDTPKENDEWPEDLVISFGDRKFLFDDKDM